MSQKSNYELHMDQYYKLVEVADPDVSKRTLKTQLAITGACPFGSEKYADETMGILQARINEEDPKQNRVAQLRRVGEFMAHMTSSPKVDKLIEAVEEVATTATGKRQVLRGLGEHCSITGVLGLETKLRARWEL